MWFAHMLQRTRLERQTSAIALKEADCRAVSHALQEKAQEVDLYKMQLDEDRKDTVAAVAAEQRRTEQAQREALALVSSNY